MFFLIVTWLNLMQKHIYKLDFDFVWITTFQKIVKIASRNKWTTPNGASTFNC